MTRCKLLVPAAICAVLIGGAGFVSAYTGEELAKYAKVTFPEARAIALKAFPGKTRRGVEKEKGGSGTLFDIKNGGMTSKSVSTPRPASCWRTAPKAHKPIKNVCKKPGHCLEQINPYQSG